MLYATCRSECCLIALTEDVLQSLYFLVDVYLRIVMRTKGAAGIGLAFSQVDWIESCTLRNSAKFHWILMVLALKLTSNFTNFFHT